MINKPRGTEDILPSDSPLWQKIEQTAREVCSVYISFCTTSVVSPTPL